MGNKHQKKKWEVWDHPYEECKYYKTSDEKYITEVLGVELEFTNFNDLIEFWRAFHKGKIRSVC